MFVLTRFCALAAPLLGLFALSACNDSPAPSPVRDQVVDMSAHGQQKSRMCTACHGPNGISRVASYPSLAGKPADFLAEQLQAFRSGARDNPMMTSVAKSLSDEDILALAAYYAALPAAPEAQP